MEVDLDVGMLVEPQPVEPECATLQCAQCSSSFGDPLELEQHIFQEHAPQIHQHQLQLQHQLQQQLEQQDQQQNLQFQLQQQFQLHQHQQQHQQLPDAQQQFLFPVAATATATATAEPEHPRFACTQCKKRFFHAGALHDHVRNHQAGRGSRNTGSINNSVLDNGSVQHQQEHESSPFLHSFTEFSPSTPVVPVFPVVAPSVDAFSDTSFGFRFLSSFATPSASSVTTASPFSQTEAVTATVAETTATAVVVKSFSCEQCSKEFSTAVALEQHRYLHRVQEVRIAGSEENSVGGVAGAAIGHNSMSGGVRAYSDAPARAVRARPVYSKPKRPQDPIALLYKEYEERFAACDVDVDAFEASERTTSTKTQSKKMFEHPDASLSAFFCEHAKSEASEARRWASPFPSDPVYTAVARPVTWIFPSD